MIFFPLSHQSAAITRHIREFICQTYLIVTGRSFFFRSDRYFLELRQSEYMLE